MKLIKRLVCALRRPSVKYSLGTLLIGGALLGMVFIGGATAMMHSTNSLEFCISCHEMADTVYQEYKDTIHYRNASGVRAECPDCHVPKEFFPMLKAKIIAAKDVWHTILGTIDTPEKFEAHRWEMASRVWKQMEETDSATCRSCHDWTQMDFSEQPRLARRKHERAMDRGETCIECHKGIAHYQPDEPMEPEVADGG